MYGFRRDPVLIWSIMLALNLGVIAWKVVLDKKRKEPYDYVLIGTSVLIAILSLFLIWYFL